MWQVWGQHTERGLSGWYVFFFLFTNSSLHKMMLEELDKPMSCFLMKRCSPCLRRCGVVAVWNTGSHFSSLTCPWTRFPWKPTPVTLLTPAAGMSLIIVWAQLHLFRLPSVNHSNLVPALFAAVTLLTSRGSERQFNFESFNTGPWERLSPGLHRRFQTATCQPTPTPQWARSVHGHGSPWVLTWVSPHRPTPRSFWVFFP